MESKHSQIKSNLAEAFQKSLSGHPLRVPFIKFSFHVFRLFIWAFLSKWIPFFILFHYAWAFPFLC